MKSFIIKIYTFLLVVMICASLQGKEKTNKDDLEKDQLLQSTNSLKNFSAVYMHRTSHPTRDHTRTYRSLSKQNKNVYNSLPSKQQDRVVRKHKQTGNVGRALAEVILDDQNDHDRQDMVNDSDYAPKRKNLKKKVPHAPHKKLSRYNDHQMDFDDDDNMDDDDMYSYNEYNDYEHDE